MIASLVIESGPNPVLEFVVSVVVLGFGLGIAALYIAGRRAEARPRDAANVAMPPALPRIGGARPWRKLVAVICPLLSVMFVAGLYGLNRDTPKNVFAAYWIIMLGLVLWLLGLALRDIMYTRRVLSGYRKGTMTLSGEPTGDNDQAAG